MELSLDTKPSKINLDEKKKYLSFSKKGYCIIKEGISISSLENIKLKLNVKPNITTDYGITPNSFKVYLENNKKIYLPKYFGLKEFGPPSKNKLYDGNDINIEFKGSLRDKQIPIINKFIDSCHFGTNENYDKSNGGIISVGCGFGKTVLSLYLISKIKKKTLVIVHKEFLMNQWKERILEYLPSARIGFIQGSKVDIDDKDIVIGMLQSISMKDYKSEVFTNFGFCVIDECHHIGAEVFSRSLFKINSKYMLGLSATPKRKDGLNKVFEWFIGPYIHKQLNKDKKYVDVNMVYYDNLDPSYNKIEYNFRGKPVLPKMITNISKCYSRNNLIVDLLIYVCKDINRKVLVLGDRREQLCELEKLLGNKNVNNVGYYVGGMKEENLKKSELCQILLATYSMSSEGMDIPSLNTLFLISSKSDIEQSVGRILRKEHEGQPAMIYDIVDNFSSFGNQARKRINFYNKNNYNIMVSQANDFNDEKDELLKNATKFIPLIHPSKKKKNIQKGKCLLD